MSHSLYFISILADAFASGGSRGDLEAALRRIETLGRDPAYAEGYRQFQQFLEHAAASAQRRDAAAKVEFELLLEQLAAGGGIGEPTRAHHFANADFCDVLQACARAPASAEPMAVQLCRDGQLLRQWSPANEPVMKVAQVVPGTYEVRLDNGRQLWEGALSVEELHWSKACPDRPLQMAADTGDPSPAPVSLRADLLEGQIELRVIPGLETGRIELRCANEDSANA